MNMAESLVWINHTIGVHNGLFSDQWQAITWTNDDLLTASQEQASVKLQSKYEHLEMSYKNSTIFTFLLTKMAWYHMK